MSLHIHTEATIIIHIATINSVITIPTQVSDTIINYIPIETGIALKTITMVLINTITIRIQTIINTADINKLTNKAFMMVINKNIKKDLLNWVTKYQRSQYL